MKLRIAASRSFLEFFFLGRLSWRPLSFHWTRATEPNRQHPLESRFCCGSCVVSWDRSFAESIVLPGGIVLTSLREAIAYLVKTVPASERRLPAVLTAAEMLTNAAEHGGSMELACIATLQAINRHHQREFNPDRKDTHWGKRKLKRAQ